jgi:hypothetical protein
MGFIDELLFSKYRSQNGFLSKFSSHPKGRLETTGNNGGSRGIFGIT